LVLKYIFVNFQCPFDGDRRQIDRQIDRYGVPEKDPVGRE